MASYTYEAEQEDVLQRQLDAQEISVNANLVTGTNDFPGRTIVDNSTIAVTVITVDFQEPIKKYFKVIARNRLTGAILPLLSRPSLLVPNSIRIKVDATAQTGVTLDNATFVQV